MLGDRSIHHPFSFSNSFFHCSEIGPRKDGLFGSSKMHCTQVSVCEIVMLCHVYTSFFLSDTSKRIPCESQSHLTIGQMAFLRQMSRAKNEREKEKKGNVIRRSGGGQDRWIWRLKKVHLSSTLWNRRKIICHRERGIVAETTYTNIIMLQGEGGGVRYTQCWCIVLELPVGALLVYRAGRL